MVDRLRRIVGVVARPHYRLALKWDSGDAMTVSLVDLIRLGGVFEFLQDQGKFSAVRIGERGRAVEWPEPKDDLGYPMVEIDAEALYERGKHQREVPSPT